MFAPHLLCVCSFCSIPSSPSTGVCSTAQTQRAPNIQHLHFCVRSCISHCCGINWQLWPEISISPKHPKNHHRAW